MKFISVVGTRPNFVKEFLIQRECQSRGIDEILVHTGQHYDYEMSQVFFDGFNLPPPDHYLNIKNMSNVQLTGETILRLNELLIEENPDFVLSYGDVNTTLAAAVASVKNKIPFAHVEGGIRGDNLYNPEEINRRVADVLSEVIYCCTKTDVKNLEIENYPKRRIVLSGDLMKDALVHTVDEHKIDVSVKDYMVLTLHREENVEAPERLNNIFKGLIDSDQRIIFPAHPRTIKRLNQNGLMSSIAKSRIEIVKPMAYLEFTKLLAGAQKVLTDSGGVRREAYLLQKPCIVLIELSWFPEISAAGWKVLTGPDPVRISRLINEFEPDGEHVEIFGDGKAYLRIIDDLEERFA